ncbi:MAG: family 16 glycosylhydrolase [Flavipsychrobacter sp.]|nr:family 16 glycosylhydrolase [Flavipsychrobacter sp.]
MKTPFSRGAFYLLFISSLIINNFSILYGQCGIDYSRWHIVYDEQFNEPNVSDWLQFTSGGPFTKGWRIEDTYTCHCDNNPNGCPPANMIQFGGNAISMDYANGYAIFGNKKLVTPTPTHGWEASFVRSTQEDIYMADLTSPGEPGYIFGMFEIRCKLPKSPDNIFSAFWLSGANTWPPEIDVFEHRTNSDSNIRNEIFSTVHWSPTWAWGDDNGCSNYYRFNELNYFDLFNNFHTYTAVWTPTQITWFFDGKELKTDAIASHLPGFFDPTPSSGDAYYRDFFLHNKMQMVINCITQNCEVSEPLDGLVVDYVRVYKPLDNRTKFPTETYEDYYNYLSTIYSTAVSSYKTTHDWTRNLIDSTGFAPVQIHSNLNGYQGGGKYTYIGNYNLLWSTYYGPGGTFYSVPVDWAHDADGDLSLSNDGYRTWYRKGSNIWYEQGGIFTMIPTVTNAIGGTRYSNIKAINSGTAIAYVGAAPSGLGYGVYASVMTSPGYWVTTPISPTFPSAPSNIIYNQTQTQIFYIVNNKLWASYDSPTAPGWVTSQISGPFDMVLPGIAFGKSPNGQDAVFFRTSGNKLYFYEWNPTSSSFTSQQPFLAKTSWSSTPVVVNNVSDNNIIVGIDPANQQYYYVGTDLRPYYISYDGTGWGTSYLDLDLPNVLGDFQLVKMGYPIGDFHLAYTSTNNFIRTLKWQSCENLNPPCDQVRYQKPSTIRLTSPDSSEMENNFRIFPNPSSGKFWIEIPSNNSVVSISTIVGQILEADYKINDGMLAFDISSFPSGVYFVNVSTETNSKTLKLIKY